MLIWVAALRCEAKPVIDYYRLEKSTHHRRFSLYHNDRFCCVVSGVGKSAVMQATAWAAALQVSQPAIAWINIGTAGAEQDEVGSVFWVEQILSPHADPCFPAPLLNHDISARSCFTLDGPSTDYKPELLYDMEASAFFMAASRFSASELIHCLKVISDNKNHPLQRDKATVSRLIQQNMARIDAFANSLMQLKTKQCPDKY
ncbi:MAG: hypothetical protein GY784_12370 [Gammaproteobacteria bacterium]|nr:hypothetical protein [Gammaproteobacteria bacterium]